MDGRSRLIRGLFGCRCFVKDRIQGGFYLRDHGINQMLVFGCFRISICVDQGG